MSLNATNNDFPGPSLHGSVDSGNDNQLETFKETQATQVLLTYFPPIIIAMGIFGNFVCLIVLFRLTRNLLPSCLYLCIGTVVDLIVLFLMCANDWSHYAFGSGMAKNAMLYNQSLCKFYPFLSDFILHLSIWLLAAAITEVGLVYMRPHRIHKICTLDRARAAILLLIVILVCVNTHCFWSYDLVEVEGELYANYKEKVYECKTLRQGTSEKFVRIGLPVIDILVSDLIPLSIVLSFTVIIIVRWENLKQPVSKQKQNKNATSPCGSSTSNTFPKKHFKLLFVTPKDFESVRELHKAMLIICIAYLILLSPKCVYDIFFFIADDEKLAVIRQSPALDAKLELGRAVCYMLFYMFIISKGCILVASSGKFRNKVVSLFTCKVCQVKCKSTKRHRSVLESREYGTQDCAQGRPLLYKHSGDDCACQSRSRDRLVNSQEQDSSTMCRNYCNTAAQKVIDQELKTTRAFQRDFSITTV